MVGDVCRDADVEVGEGDRHYDVEWKAGRWTEIYSAGSFPFAVGNNYLAAFLICRLGRFFGEEAGDLLGGDAVEVHEHLHFPLGDDGEAAGVVVFVVVGIGYVVELFFYPLGVAERCAEEKDVAYQLAAGLFYACGGVGVAFGFGCEHSCAGKLT